MRTPERLTIMAAAAVLTVFLTWPIAGEMGSVGRLASGDGRYSVWNIAWIAHALTTSPTSLYNANIFYPFPNALAFSEPNIVGGVLAVPVWVLTHNPYAALNWALLCSFLLSTLTMYALVWHLTASRTGAAVAAISFGFCPFVFAHLAHIQLLMTFGLPLVLLALHRFVERPSPGRAAALGGAIAVSGLACGYYGMFGALTGGLGLVWFGLATSHRRSLRYWGLSLGAAVVTICIVAPFLSPVVTTSFTRRAEDARLFSANWASYAASPAVAHEWLLNLVPDRAWRDVLFPGVLPLALGAIALFSIRRSRVVGFYALVGGLGLWASFGPDAGLYALLQSTLPFFSLLRASARFGLLVTLAAAVLGGIGAAALERRLRAHGRDVRAAFGTALVGMAIGGSYVGELFLTPAPPVTTAHQRLTALPWGPVVAFPFFSGPQDRDRHTEYMLMSTFHWKPLLNGYSDYIPTRAFQDANVLSTFPSMNAWSVMRARGARYVLVYWQSYDPAARQQLVAETRQLREYLRSIVDDTDVSLFEVIAWPAGTRTE
jgi:hypothetical protein